MDKKYTKSQKTVLWIVFGIFSIYALSLIFPFIWMLVNSFKTNSEFFNNIWALPSKLTFSNYKNVFSYRMYTQTGSYGIFQMFIFSIIITLAATLVNTLLSAMAAYVVARYEFRGRNLIYSVAVFTLIMPVVGTLPAQFRLMQNLRLHNTVLGLLVLYSGAFGFTFFILHGYFKNLSHTYTEAALVDGANDFQVFTRIMLPMARPVLVSTAIIYAIEIWNDYITPSLYLKNYPTLAVGVRYLSQSMLSQGAYSEMFATMIISIMPILIVFVVFRKTIMENMIAGGIKG